MRNLIGLAALSLIASVALGAPRHDPVLLITPPRDGSPLLTRITSDRPIARTITRDRGVVEFNVPTTGVPNEGPLRYGVDPQSANELIAVRTREPLPTVLISPYEEINGRTRDEIRRQFPYARRVDTITSDLRQAQRQYLKDRGVILSVRSFSGDRSVLRNSSAPAPRVVRADEEIAIRPTRVLPPND